MQGVAARRVVRTARSGCRRHAADGRAFHTVEAAPSPVRLARSSPILESLSRTLRGDVEIYSVFEADAAAARRWMADRKHTLPPVHTLEAAVRCRLSAEKTIFERARGENRVGPRHSGSVSASRADIGRCFA